MYTNRAYIIYEAYRIISINKKSNSVLVDKTLDDYMIFQCQTRPTLKNNYSPDDTAYIIVILIIHQ